MLTSLLPLVSLLLVHPQSTTPSPVPTPTPPLWKHHPQYPNGVIINLSSINATIFGVEATGFDYILGGPNGVPEAIETAEHFARIFHTGGPEEVLVAFLNATTGGGTPMERVVPFDRQWLCQDLSCPMNEGAEACEGVEVECWEGRSEL